MSYDVRQWLEQIKALQQQLAQLQQELDSAHASAAKWRGLYETEAQQRRTDAHLAKGKFEQLQTELQRLRGVSSEASTAAIADSELATQLQALTIPEELKQNLLEALVQRDNANQEIHRLTQALKAEQASHAQTRQSLTEALGDAIAQLSQNKESTESESQSVKRQ